MAKQSQLMGFILFTMLLTTAGKCIFSFQGVSIYQPVSRFSEGLLSGGGACGLICKPLDIHPHICRFICVDPFHPVSMCVLERVYVGIAEQPVYGK